MSRPRPPSVYRLLAALVAGRVAVGLHRAQRCQKPGCDGLATIYGYCFDHGG